MMCKCETAWAFQLRVAHAQGYRQPTAEELDQMEQEAASLVLSYRTDPTVIAELTARDLAESLWEKSQQASID